MSEKKLSPLELIKLANGWIGKNNDGMVKYYLEKAIERIETAEQSAQTDLANESANEVDSVTQALRNLGDAIAPSKR